ncbi:dCTP deaminase domain-containing protein [Streptomyces sp. NPDC058319]|uniref:dCTP deaminase n=1 Tax=unclassified Streptomyces TaxID=2593676 RepID=UPI0036EFB0F9
MLSAASLAWLISQGTMEWTGRFRGDGLLLTLGSPLQPIKAPSAPLIDLADQPSIDHLYSEPITEWRTYELMPGEMLLGAVHEPLRLGGSLMGMIGGLSHLARVGLAVHVTSPFVLPGWNGHLTLELVNTGPAVLRLHHGMPLARLLFFALDSVCGDDVAPHPFYGREADLRSRYADEFPVGPTRR